MARLTKKQREALAKAKASKTAAEESDTGKTGPDSEEMKLSSMPMKGK